MCLEEHFGRECDFSKAAPLYTVRYTRRCACAALGGRRRVGLEVTFASSS